MMVALLILKGDGSHDIRMLVQNCVRLETLFKFGLNQHSPHPVYPAVLQSWRQVCIGRDQHELIDASGFSNRGDIKPQHHIHALLNEIRFEVLIFKLLGECSCRNLLQDVGFQLPPGKSQTPFSCRKIVVFREVRKKCVGVFERSLRVGNGTPLFAFVKRRIVIENAVNLFFFFKTGQRKTGYRLCCVGYPRFFETSPEAAPVDHQCRVHSNSPRIEVRPGLMKGAGALYDGSTSEPCVYRPKIRSFCPKTRVGIVNFLAALSFFVKPTSRHRVDQAGAA